MKKFLLFTLVLLAAALVWPQQARATVCAATGYVAIHEESKKCYQGLRDWCAENEPRPNKGWKIYEGEKNDPVTTETFLTPLGQCQTAAYAEPNERTCCQQLSLGAVAQLEAVKVRPVQTRSEEIRSFAIVGALVIAVAVFLAYHFVFKRRKKKTQ